MTPKGRKMSLPNRLEKSPSYVLITLHTVFNLSFSWQAATEKLLQQFVTKCADRKHQLEASREFHVYMRESSELEQWIGEQMQMATSEEYGQDYEHLQVSVCLVSWPFPSIEINLMLLFLLYLPDHPEALWRVPVGHRSWSGPVQQSGQNGHSSH